MKYPEDYINKIICGDCLEVMKGIPDNSVDLTVTSPPYGQIRDYKGYNFDFENIAKELYRISATVVWVVNDQTVGGSESGESFRQALYFKEIGFNLHDTMIYLKDGFPFPEATRYQPIFEYMFVFTKGKIKTFNPIKKKNIWGNLVYKERERGKDGVVHSKDERYILNEGNVSNCWFYRVGYMKSTTDTFAYDHPAIFPDNLAYDHILSWSNKGDIILDPMSGSGTVAKMAKFSGRKFIGIEISQEYCEIAQRRLAQEYLFT